MPVSHSPLSSLSSGPAHAAHSLPRTHPHSPLAEDTLKAQAQLLKKFLQSKGLALNHTGCLDAVAFQYGYASWHHARAAYPVPAPAPAIAYSLLDLFLQESFSAGVSDVQISAEGGSYSVTSRRLGVSLKTEEIRAEHCDALIMAIKGRARLNLAERKIPQAGHFFWSPRGQQVTVTVCTMHTPAGETLALALRPADTQPDALSKLGLTCLAVWRKVLSSSEGLCIIGGACGSGVTTTLGASMQELLTQGRTVFTPNGQVLSPSRSLHVAELGASQFDVARDGQICLRSDADVVVLGEIRDPETAKFAIALADTGRLVIGTLHTGYLAGVQLRLNHMGVSSNDLARHLRGGLLQRLIRATCKDCKGRGCPQCQNTGYSGRTAVSECAHYPNEAAVRIAGLGVNAGPTVLDDAVGKMHRGEVTRSEVVRLFGEDAVLADQ